MVDCFVAGMVSVFRGKLCSFSQSSAASAASAALQGVCAMNQYGKWRIVESNDPLVASLPEPRIVDLSPGKFKIGSTVFGSFQMDMARPGTVSMKLYNIGFLKKTYTLVPIHTNRMALFGTGSQESIFYYLERFNP